MFVLKGLSEVSVLLVCDAMIDLPGRITEGDRFRLLFIVDNRLLRLPTPDRAELGASSLIIL